MCDVNDNYVTYVRQTHSSQLRVQSKNTAAQQAFQPVWPLFADVATIDENCDIEVEELNLVARKSRKSVDYCKKKV